MHQEQKRSCVGWSRSADGRTCVPAFAVTNTCTEHGRGGSPWGRTVNSCDMFDSHPVGTHTGSKLNQKMCIFAVTILCILVPAVLCWNCSFGAHVFPTSTNAPCPFENCQNKDVILSDTTKNVSIQWSHFPTVCLLPFPVKKPLDHSLLCLWMSMTVAVMGKKNWTDCVSFSSKLHALCINMKVIAWLWMSPAQLCSQSTEDICWSPCLKSPHKTQLFVFLNVI